MATTVTLNKNRILELLSQNKLKELFTQHLGWNNFNQTMPVQVEGTIYTLNGVVEKEGFAIYEYVNDSPEPIKYDLRKKISNKLAKTQLEHLIVFTEKNEQVWQWIKRATKNSPAVTRSEIYNPATQSGEKLYQKLEKLFFGWEDYTITDVTQRINDSLNKDKVTKKFYEEFKKNKDNFSKFIEGIKETVDKEWYSSLMLNRLMFIYFIQKKGFLNNDLNYMRNKLNEIQEKRGDNKFYSFYREFLLVLFHEGFARELNKRSVQTIQIIGKIPYLNGGLFDVHELERKYTDITIPDSAFEKIFDFFDKYDWHLDDRPVSDDKQINPDVIGHIFEKYINQKQMGAYYTKEDITEYISKNTIIPYLFEEAKKKCEVAFKENSYIWQMLKDNPDKYIYEAVKKGCDKDLPDYISNGIDDVSERDKWNTPTLEEFALPTEIWRETVERRNRYFDVKSKLENGEIKSINDFITYNLDIRQFVEDIITNAESSDVVKAFYYTIAGHIGKKSNEKEIPAMSILDPTCGSGAFLFAGLNILEPLYDACIDKMYDFKHEEPDSYKEFDSILEDIEKHPNREYFIYKSIILNNLYGVDIMKEATEIAKLRLFLKLASCAEVDYRKENFGLEALPDIDFNIRAGNSLVGFANYEELKFAVEHNSLSGQMNLLSGNTMDIIDENAQKVSLAYKRFKNTQIVSGSHEEILSAKKDLQQRLDDLNTELNQYMAKKYGIDTDKEEQYKQWLSSHEPFNWFVEFYDVIHNRGGFDIIIGNPPYVAIKKIKYLKIDVLFKCSDLYAYVVKRCVELLNKKSKLGFIIMHNIAFSRSFKDLRNLLQKTGNTYFSFFSRIPSGLFSGDVRVRNCILLYTPSTEIKQSYTTKLHRWNSDYRNYLFSNITYSRFNFNDTIPMYPSNLLSAFYNMQKTPNLTESRIGKELYYKKTAYNWLSVSNIKPPCYDKNNNLIEQTQLASLIIDREVYPYYLLLLNGKLFFSKWLIFGDDFHLTKDDLLSFNIDFKNISKEDKELLNELYNEFTDKIEATTQFKLNAGINIGTFNTASLWYITERSDKIFLKYLTSDVLKLYNSIDNHIYSTVKLNTSDSGTEEIDE